VFDLETADVIHSFWVPELAGKRDLIPTRLNHIWFKPDSVGTYTGQCAELCGYSHARMGFRVIVDSPEDFQAWVANQLRPAVAYAVARPAPAAPPAAAPAGKPGATGERPAPTGPAPARPDTAGGKAPAGTPPAQGAAPPSPAPARPDTAGGKVSAGPPPAQGAAPPQSGGAPAPAPEAAPAAPGPAQKAPGDTLVWKGGVVGDPGAGAALFQRSACVGCHTIEGTPARGKVGPNLTHIGGRERIAAELLPNTPEDMARWLHDPPGLKPGVLMPNLNLKPEQIADLVAYLESLK
jgi:cytochrome c oxidase subunit 2